MRLPTDGSACSAKTQPPPPKKKKISPKFHGGKRTPLGEGKGAILPYKYYPKNLILVRFVWFSRQNEPKLSSKKEVWIRKASQVHYAGQEKVVDKVWVG